MASYREAMRAMSRFMQKTLTKKANAQSMKTAVDVSFSGVVRDAVEGAQRP